MKILVTGCGGFAGNRIAEYLSASGHEVAGTTRDIGKSKEYRTEYAELSEEINIDFKAEVIIHSAGILPYRKPKHEEYVRGNIDSMKNLLAYARRTGVRRIINLSTIGVYGEFRDSVIDEASDRINPNAYGQTKYIAECLLRDVEGIESISLRMPGIIGSGARGVWLTNTYEKMKRNEDVVIYTPEFITKNFVWIDDLTGFIDALLKEDNWKYDVLVLACREGASIRDIVETMKENCKSQSNIMVDNSVRKPFCLDAGRAFEMGYNSLPPLEIVRKLKDIN